MEAKDVKKYSEQKHAYFLPKMLLAVAAIEGVTWVVREHNRRSREEKIEDKGR